MIMHMSEAVSAAASEKQSAAAEQISRSIECISHVTQESTSGVEQIARASEDLNLLTENLQHLKTGTLDESHLITLHRKIQRESGTIPIQ